MPIQGLYVISGEAFSRGRSTSQVVAAAVAGGARVVQLREKNMTARQLTLLALQLKDLIRTAGARLLINDRLDVALAAGADGVHLGQDDLPLDRARRLVPPGFIIGASVDNLTEAQKAVAQGADYVGLGPVFPTGTKSDAGAVVGIESLAAVARRLPIPVVAVGGIGRENIAAVIEAGASAAAVVSAVVAQEDVQAAARELARLIDGARRGKN